MTIFVPVFLLVFLVIVALIFRILYQVVNRRFARAKVSLIVLTIVTLVYGAALAGVGLASQPITLSPGERKCFDDWCFEVDGVKLSNEGVIIYGKTINSGRRAQAPDSPHAFAVIDGKVVPVECPLLSARLEGHSENPVNISFRVGDQVHQLDFYVTEGGGPSAWIIDDENSPLHAKSKWRLLPLEGSR